MPPAGTVCGAQPVCTPFVSTGLQQPTWIVPGVVRLEVAVQVVDREQLHARRPSALAANACDVPSASISPSAARTAMVRLM